VLLLLQKSWKLVLQYSRKLLKSLLLLRYIMSQVISGLRELTGAAIDEKAERNIFSRQVSALTKGNSQIFVSHLLKEGSVIWQVVIEGAPSTDRWINSALVDLVLVSSDNPTPAEVDRATKIIDFYQSGVFRQYVSMAKFDNVTYELHKIVTGSDRRLCIAIRSGDNLGIDCRVSIAYSEP
jgi:hypothetical protein